VVAPGELMPRAMARARAMAPLSGVSQIKNALRRPAREAMAQHDEIETWLDSWFSPAARERLAAAVARLR
jgi:enoyl-CoA hydratase/carnithine racemase